MTVRFGQVLMPLALLGAGFAIGRLLPVEQQSDPIGTTPAPRVDVASAAPTLEGVPAAPSVPAASVIPADELARLRESVERLPIPPLPAGEGVITVRVRTPEGQPVAGAEVILTPAFPEPRTVSHFDLAPDPLEALVRHAQRTRWARAARRVGATGVDGSVRFELLAAVDHHVDARRVGWQLVWETATRPFVRPGETAEFVGREVAEVDLDVLLPDGQPVEQANVEFKSGSEQRRYGIAGGRQRLALPPGWYEVSARGGPDDRFRSSATTVELINGRVASLRMALTASPALLVSMRFPEGEAMSRARVVIARVPDGAAPDVGLLAAPLAQREFQSATAVFHELKPGRYLVGGGRWQNGDLVVIRDVVVGEGALEVELEVPSLRREEYVPLRVLGPDGQPMHAAQLTMGYYDENTTSSSGGVETVRRPDGSRWILHGVVQAASPQGRRWIEARVPGLGVRRAEYGAREAPELTLRFEEPVTAVFEVGAIPPRYEGRVGVSLVPAPGGTGQRLHTEPSSVVPAGGEARIEGLQPGRYEAVLLVLVGAGYQEVGRSQVDLATSGARQSLALPVLHAVSLLGAEAGGLHVTPMGRAGTRWFAGFRVPAGSESVTVDGLPAGEYQASNGPRRVTFRVPGPEVVRF